MRPATLLLALVAVAGCGGAPSGAAGGVREPDLYEGCASDENWVAFDDAERAGATTDPSLAPTFAVPTAGAILDGTAPPRFAWQPTPTEPGDPLGDSRCAQCSVCGPTRMHLPPVRGTAYDIQILDGDTPVFRAITTLQVLTPPPALWSQWRGRSLTLRAYRLVLDENIPQDHAHTLPAPLTFSVAPSS